MEESLSFNTIISFMTNTNLQHYSGGERSFLRRADVRHHFYDVYFSGQRLRGCMRLAGGWQDARLAIFTGIW